MKKINIKVLILASIMILGVFITGCQENVNEVGDKGIVDSKLDENSVLITVNDNKILLKDFLDDYNSKKASYINQFGEEALDEIVYEDVSLKDMLKGDTVSTLIIDSLIEDYLSDNNITITEKEIEEHMNEFIESFGGEDDFEEYLEENSITKEVIMYRAEKELMFGRYEKMIKDNYQVSVDKLKDIYEEDKDEYITIGAKHILVEDKEEAESILKKITIENFDELAKKHSIDNSSEDGGDLGYFKRGEMVEEFENAAFNLEVNEISDIVETEHGFHIITVVDKVETFEELEDVILAHIVDQNFNEKLMDLRNEAIIDINEDLLDQIDNETSVEEGNSNSEMDINLDDINNNEDSEEDVTNEDDKK